MLVSSSGPTSLIGIIGNPLSHSLSPIMQNAAFAALNLDWLYLGLPVTDSSLKSLIKDLENIQCRGLNVTIPYKQSVAQLITELHPIARTTGAVNTLIRGPKMGWIGTNTDVEGFIAPLKMKSTNWKTKKAIVLGCGGSARAVVAALIELQFTSISVAGRKLVSLQGFVNNYKSFCPQLKYILWDRFSINSIEIEAFQQALKDADLIVNTTPIGMTKRQNTHNSLESPLTDLQLEMLKNEAVVYDLIYTPRPTLLLDKSVSKGHECIDGLEMLVHQGAASLKLWTGVKDVPINVMRDAALSYLRS
uniref:Shikimate / quinate 5-dehydrogenase n=1 Tax=Paulinella longichromatophora TaxID=1708747 RepID=A0A2H4ZPC4_9EUKA|nr:shikimate / quinate 5-dehydrogenase [Paulinella longichromatophora]